ncbi:MCE family protein [Amycolatopsis acidicola]|uniref:MCE family protein n=1 Tax=Amycolatopsis acidicola TaxID=2596893 RepID=UPI001FB7C9B7|nr:MCE family protein [Amycolatopsis acidicola]
MNWGGKNPLRTGALAAAVALVLVAAAVLAPNAWFKARTDDFHAQLANASGLQQDDPVYVAGVPAGRVTGIGLAGDRVDVAFRLDSGVGLGSTSRAEVKLMTVLGRRYLAVEPSGPGRMRAGDTIPLERTSVPYLLDDLGRQAEQTTQDLDLGRLRQMMQTLVQTVPDDPAQLGQALDGVTAVTGMISGNSGQITQLLDGTQQLTDTLLAQQNTLVSLLGNADLVLKTLMDRRTAITQLIDDVSALTTTASQLLHDDGPQLDSLLDQLHGITGTLTANSQNLGAAIDKLAPTARYLANATGNGDWADVSGPAGPLPDNVLCLAGLAKGCK